MESLPVDDARGCGYWSVAAYPPGPRGRRGDGKPRPAGELAYWLYRSATPGPHPVIVSINGGGWVLATTSGRLAVPGTWCAHRRAGRLGTTGTARNTRSPPRVDDGYAALRRVAEHAAELAGFRPAGRPAGVGRQHGDRDKATWPASRMGLRIAGQALLTLPTDTRRYPSHTPRTPSVTGRPPG